MTLREVCADAIGIDADPMGCAFLIAAVLRTGVQGEPSTFEGECASINKAAELLGIDPTSPASIRWWLDDIKALADLDMPNEFWAALVDSADADEANDQEDIPQ